jgi:ubiquinone biosynthesis protein UbiJ
VAHIRLGIFAKGTSARVLALGLLCTRCLQSVHMLQSLRALVVPAAMQRLTLWVNHLLSAEPVAMQRLLPHAGKRLRVEMIDWPSLLPVPPTAEFEVTPAGLLEICDEGSPGEPRAALTLQVAAANPAGLMARLATGGRPEVSVQGEAQFAADIQWLADNLRWDIEADLAHVLGPVPARQLASLGAAVAAALRRLAPAADKP